MQFFKGLCFRNGRSIPEAVPKITEIAFSIFIFFQLLNILSIICERTVYKRIYIIFTQSRCCFPSNYTHKNHSIPAIFNALRATFVPRRSSPFQPTHDSTIILSNAHKQCQSKSEPIRFPFWHKKILPALQKNWQELGGRGGIRTHVGFHPT